MGQLGEVMSEPHKIGECLPTPERGREHYCADCEKVWYAVSDEAGGFIWFDNTSPRGLEEAASRQRKRGLPSSLTRSARQRTLERFGVLEVRPGDSVLILLRDLGPDTDGRPFTQVLAEDLGNTYPGVRF